MTADCTWIVHFQRAMTALQMRKTHFRSADSQRSSGIFREPVHHHAMSHFEALSRLTNGDWRSER